MALKRKNVDMINDETEDLIKLFSLKGKYRLLGSQTYRAVQYGSDYDIATEIKGTTGEKVAKMLQKAYEEAKKNPDYWITDMKAGWDERLIYKGDYSKDSVNMYLKLHKDLIPKSRASAIRRATGEEEIKLIRDLFILRWKPADVKRGWVKMLDGEKKCLKDAVLDKTMMKIDLLGKVGNQFVEVSENYTIKTKGESNVVPFSKTELEETYEDEIHYYSRTNAFKALKRLFSALKLDGEKENLPAMEKLVEFFNSQIGYLNKIKNELGILEQVLTQDFRKVKWEDVEANLQFIKEQVSNIYEVDIRNGVFSIIDDMTEKNALSQIKKLMEYFGGIINQHSRVFLKSLKP
tara:strand:+ start:10302 stop:11348 length:1047 start_codon:yes stop_codon:yes gene_type:complete